MHPTYRLNPTLKLELTNNLDSEARRYLLSADGRNFYVNDAVASIVRGLQAEGDPERVFQNVAKTFNIGREAYDKLLGVQLPQMGVLVPDGAAKAPQGDAATPESITFLFPLVPRLIARKLAAPAALLFAKPVACAAMLLALATLAVALLGHGFDPAGLAELLGAPVGFTALQYGQLYLVILLIGVTHELGHLAAAWRFGCEIDRINVGLYLIFPVFYVDMSNTWKLSAAQRIAVNLGGVYFQFLVTMILLAVAQATASGMLTYAVHISLYLILLNLNPFLKFDGYWVYGDYFNIVNLRKQHLKLLGGFLHASPMRWPGMARAAWKANPALAFYAVSGTLFLLYFAYLLGKVLFESLMRLPQRFAEMTAAVSNGSGEWMGVDAVAGMSYQCFLICASLIIARRSIAFGMSAWQHGRTGARIA